MEILLLFSVVAFLYASVGHGGASGYIALMAIFAFPQSEIKSNALFLNLFVSFISFTQFFKKEEFPFNLFFILIIFSIPMAFLGGMWTLDNKWYKIILGLILFIPIVKFLGFFPKMQFQVKQNLLLVIVLGLLIGLLSGLLGIGGGVILSPILILLGWCTVKQTAAVSAIFIFVNSLAGLLGKSFATLQFSENIVQILIFTLFGGILGGFFGANKFKILWIQYTLAFVLIIACFKLFTT